MWKHIKKMCGYDTSLKEQDMLQTTGIENDPNSFYTWFDNTDFQEKRRQVMGCLLDAEGIEITLNEVEKVMSKVNLRKAMGPDGISGAVNKRCSRELSPIFHIFNWSMESQEIPSIWKKEPQSYHYQKPLLQQFWMT